MLKTHYPLIIFAAGWLLAFFLLLRTQRFIPAALLGLIGGLWVTYAGSIEDWYRHLGTDSFSEAQNFDLAEAWFFLTSVTQVLHPEKFRRIIAVLALGAVLARALYLLLNHDRVRGVRIGRVPVRTLSLVVLPMALIAMPLYGKSQQALNAFGSNSATYKHAADNFQRHAGTPVIPRSAPTGLDVVVYIGEATTAMNMGLYGYLRPTTPLLDAFHAENPGLLVFHNVFSTHTHTSSSLLEALSIAVDPEQDFLPITERQRISIVDLLKQAQISSYLASNQGASGTWNMASSIIFRNATERRFSFNSTGLGNSESNVERPADHAYFSDAVLRLASSRNHDGSAVSFLHSYSGHGPYLRNIPKEFRKNVDDLISVQQAEAVVGDGGEPIANIEHYDAALRYVDFSVHSVLEQVRLASTPTVFVYFADHGEAAYADRGHDSSRFLHEMARIPFLVYFNDAAANRHAPLFEQFKVAAQSRQVATLAQFPATLLRLLGYRTEGGYEGVGMDAPETLSPILVRSTASGPTHIHIGGRAMEPELVARMGNGTDNATALFLARQRLKEPNTHVCQHRSNTLAKALRGALATDCLEFDLTVQDDGFLSVYHPAAPSVGLGMEVIIDIAERNDLALWIDGKNLHQLKSCRALNTFFNQRPEWHGKNVLVEFPPETGGAGDDVRGCVAELRSKGFRTSFYVPTKIAITCAASVSEGEVTAPACMELDTALRQAINTGVFSDFSFDYGAIKAMEASDMARQLPWNTRGIEPSDISGADPARFHMIAANSSGPNNR